MEDTPSLPDPSLGSDIRLDKEPGAQPTSALSLTPAADQQPFYRIARYYRWVNLLFSVGLDHYWRRVAVRSLQLPATGLVLDIGCGGGEMLELIPSTWIKIGIDPEFEMMRQARQRFSMIVGFGEELPFASHTFHRVTSAWTLRNLRSRSRVFEEVFRVLKRGGRVSLVDFSPPSPKLWYGPLLKIYVGHMIPFLGGVFLGDREAYHYLARSILTFPQPHFIARELEATGFCQITWKRLSGGLAVVYSGMKP